MNTGQILLTMGALVLFTLTVINVNKNLIENEELMNEMRFGLEAVSLATSMIEEASQLPFDEVSWDSTKLSKELVDLTQHYGLGPDAGETGLSTFDDFDDFHNYIRYDTTLQNIYITKCDVSYITPTHPNLKELSRTLFKRLNVTITTPSSSDSLTMKYIHGYWYFN